MKEAEIRRMKSEDPDLSGGRGKMPEARSQKSEGEKRVVVPREVFLSRARSESAFALATLMLFAALLLIAMTVAMPDLKTQSRREKELESQFRAMQYVRAIQAYNRKFPNQWPTSIDALMNTNNVRFLRRKWTDPLTKDGEWRFIHLGPNGAVIDSKTTAVTPAVPSATGTSTAAGSPPSTSGPRSSSGFSLGTGTSSSGLGTSTLSATQISNLPIVGVASHSEEDAIMTCNGYTRYSEMEYIALPGGQLGGTGCYKGVPITMLSQTGLVPGQPVPGQPVPAGPGTAKPGVGLGGPPPTGTQPPPGGNPFGTPPPKN